MIKDNDVRGYGRSSALSGSLTKKNFSLLAKRLKQNRIYLMVICATLVVGASLAITKPGIGYQVLVNGNHIGFTKNPKQIENVLSSLDKDLRVLNGDDIKYDMDIKFVEGKLGNNKLINADDLKVIVSSVLTVNKPAYILKTDQGIAFAIDSKESMNSILESVKEKYTKGKKDAKAEIVSTVALIQADSVPVDKIYNYNQAMSHINANEEAAKVNFDVKVTYTGTSEKPVKKGVTTVYDDSMYEDDMRIKTVGSDGVKSVQSKITEINGEFVKSDVISEKVIKAPVNKVIVVGTKPRIPGVLQIAYHYIGVPYVWGGTSPAGFDCSGFTQYVYARRGVYLPRTTYEQVNVGRRVSYGNLRAGDLVHFPGHVGIYIGDGMMIHAPRPGRSVEVASISGRQFLFGTRVE